MKTRQPMTIFPETTHKDKNISNNAGSLGVPGKNLLANAGDMGLMPGPGRFHMPQSNQARASTATVGQVSSGRALGSGQCCPHCHGSHPGA